MQTVKVNGVGGEWTKTTVTVQGKACRRIMAPDGSKDYDYEGVRSVVRLRHTSKLAIAIEAEIVKLS
jgi:hypothetical protein